MMKVQRGVVDMEVRVRVEEQKLNTGFVVLCMSRGGILYILERKQSR